MNAFKETWTVLAGTALFYVLVLGVAGELHRSSRALEFFATLWVVQAAATLWRAWRRSRTSSSPPEAGPKVETAGYLHDS